MRFIGTLGIGVVVVCSASTSFAVTPVAGGLTSDFQSWLSTHGYGAYDFNRGDLVGGSYGGRTSPGQAIVNQPVIFIHGNSDRALGGDEGGWQQSLDYFTANGYTEAELYATTWGDADAALAAYQTHNEDNVMHVRKFIEAVLAYTGATKVDIISHSMGVTLARKAVKGGTAHDEDTNTSYNVGSSLKTSVDTFVGIAGANLGLVDCYDTGPTTPTCDAVNGLYPGVLTYFGVTDRSAFLNDLASSSGYEGSTRYAIFSTVDEVIGYGDVIYGGYTSAIPGDTHNVIYTTAPYGHFGCRDLTTAQQLSMVKNHTY